MSKYGGREEKRIEDAYGDSDIQSTQYRRMQASLVPSHKWQEGQFLDNKIDLFGQRRQVVLNIDEHNMLLERLVQTVINLEISEDDKIKESPLLRLYLCYKATKQLSGESLSFYIWLTTITREDAVRNQTVNGMLPVLPNDSIRIKQELQSGYLFSIDIPCAAELTIRTFKYTLKGIIFGLKMQGRGIQYARKGNNEEDNNNNLKLNWSDKLTFTSWCKFNSNNKRRNERKTSYGNINYFFRFRNCTKDPFVSNLTIASVTARKYFVKNLPNEHIIYGGYNSVDVDNTSIDDNVKFVTLREFVSTAVCSIPLDATKLPIVSSENKHNNFILNDLKDFFSKNEVINEIILIDLNPSRYNLNVGADKQECNFDDLY